MAFTRGQRQARSRGHPGSASAGAAAATQHCAATLGTTVTVAFLTTMRVPERRSWNRNGLPAQQTPLPPTTPSNTGTHYRTPPAGTADRLAHTVLHRHVGGWRVERAGRGVQTERVRAGKRERNLVIGGWKGEGIEVLAAACP